MNRAFGVSDYERHDEGRRRGGRRAEGSRRRSRKRAALKWTLAAMVFAFALTLGLMKPFSAAGSHTPPTLPLTAPVPTDCVAGDPTLATLASIPPDRRVGGSSNRTHAGTLGPDAVWANSTTFGKQTVLDVSGSELVIDGRVVSRSHIIMGGSTNQLRHGTEYGLRSNPPNEPAFDLPGSTNCFSGPDPDGAGTLYAPGAPNQVPRSTPTQPAGFPVNFDFDNNSIFHEHFAPGSPAAIAAGGLGQYYQCTSTPAVNTIPSPLTCDTSSGKLSGSVQGAEMATGLYYVQGEVDLSPSNLNATVTIVTRGKMKVSGSNQTTFTAYTHSLLFMSELGVVNSEAGDGESALLVEGSTSFFEGGHIFAPKGRITLAGSRNSFFCTVMGDRVTLNGQLLYISNDDCSKPTVTTEIHAVIGDDEHVNLGDGASAVEVGTSVHDKVVVASSSGDELTGTITLERFTNGTCTGPADATATWDANGGPPDPTGGTYAPATTVTIDPALPFTPSVGIYSYRASYDGDPDNPGPVIGACEGPLRVVDASILIEGTDTNRVGEQHTFTVTVKTNNGSGGFVNAPDGTKPTVTITPTGFIPVADNCAGAGTVNGQCTVVIDSTAANIYTANATVTISVGGINVTRDTDPATANVPCGGGQTSCGPAVKTYVDARISITPGEKTNEVGDPHTFTVTVEVNNGSGWANAPNGTKPTVTILPAGFTLVSDSCDNPGTVDGKCTVVINSTTPGVFTANASVTVTVGGLEITRDTDPNTGAPCGDGQTSCGPGVKTYVDASILIEGTDTNRVGEQHTFTVTVKTNNGSGGFVNAPDGTKPTVTITPTGFIPVADNCAGAGTVNGQCTVVIDSTAANIYTANATVTISVGGINVTRDTDPATANVPCGGGQTSCGPAVKTYVNARISLDPLAAENPLNEPHVVTVLVEVNDGTGWKPATVGDVSWLLSDAGGSNAVFDAAASTCDDDQPDPNDNLNDDGECTIVFTSASAGTTTVNATAKVTVGGLEITRTTGTAANTAAGGTDDATKDWVGRGATLLIIDEDSIDNGIHVNKLGGLITPSGPQFFSDKEVNDDIAAYGQRTPLRYFNNPANPGKQQITVKTGQTGDEGWFAPTCIPQKWVSGTSNTCLENPTRQTGINNYWGGTVPQNRLDKIPAVMPLRSLGLNSLIGKDICAVVYDSDISINYDRTNFPFTSGNLQGATLGIVAFKVDLVRTLPNFSSSTLPQVTITIQDPKTCNPTELFNAPVPRSSSVPNDINGANPITSTGSNGYRQLLTYPDKDLFF